MPALRLGQAALALALLATACYGRFQPADGDLEAGAPDGDADLDLDAEPDRDAEASGDSDSDSEARADSDALDGDEDDGAVTFVDRSAESFGAGSFVGTRFSPDEGVRLLDGVAEGELVSRVFDAGSAVSWETIRWEPRAPYGKPAPDGRAAETGYAAGGLDMAANVLLLHFDGGRALADGEPAADGSGHGNHALVRTTGAALEPVAGRIDLAVADRLDTYLVVPLGSTDDFDFGLDDLSWALWVNTTEGCAERNRVHLGIDGLGAERTHLWLGTTRSTGTICPAGEAGCRAGGNFRSVHSAVDGSGFCGRTVVNDGRWHHLVVVKSGHASATLRLYVDGVLEAGLSVAFIEPFGFPGDPDLTVGDFTGATYPASGALDEVAIWRRALTEAEVGALYRRGALRLRLQVRACEEPGCSDSPAFVGPDGSPASFFLDRRPASSSITEQALPPLSGRFVQYRALFESDLPAESPVLVSVAIEGRRR